MQTDLACEGVIARSTAYFTLMVIVAAAFLCTMDRLVLNLLVDPIRGDLGISETQFSLLQGASFTIINALAALPFGWLADRSSRRNLLIVGVSVWSLATMIGGFCLHFEAFFTARVFVGLGEAALWPVGVSLIANVIPAAQRGRAIGMVLLGQILGSGASLILTGLVMRMAAGGAFSALPLLKGLVPWRVVLVLWGLLGVPVIAMLFAVKEPRRPASAPDAVDLGSVRRFVTYIGRGWRVMLPMYLGAAAVSTGVYALGAWAPSFFLRRFGMSPSELGPVLGVIGIGGGILGTTLAGFVADREEKRGQPDRKLTALMVTALACVPVAGLCLAPNPIVAYSIQGLSLIFFPITGALNIIAMQDLVPDDMRGKAMSVMALISSLFGASLGPTLVALVTQHVFGDVAKVGYSIATVLAPAMVLGALCFYAVRKGRSAVGARGVAYAA